MKLSLLSILLFSSCLSVVTPSDAMEAQSFQHLDGPIVTGKRKRQQTSANAPREEKRTRANSCIQESYPILEHTSLLPYLSAKKKKDPHILHLNEQYESCCQQIKELLEQPNGINFLNFSQIHLSLKEIFNQLKPLVTPHFATSLGKDLLNSKAMLYNEAFNFSSYLFRDSSQDNLPLSSMIADCVAKSQDYTPYPSPLAERTRLWLPYALASILLDQGYLTKSPGKKRTGKTTTKLSLVYSLNRPKLETPEPFFLLPSCYDTSFINKYLVNHPYPLSDYFISQMLQVSSFAPLPSSPLVIHPALQLLPIWDRKHYGKECPISTRKKLFDLYAIAIQTIGSIDLQTYNKILNRLCLHSCHLATEINPRTNKPYAQDALYFLNNESYINRCPSEEDLNYAYLLLCAGELDKGYNLLISTLMAFPTIKPSDLPLFMVEKFESVTAQYLKDLPFFLQGWFDQAFLETRMSTGTIDPFDSLEMEDISAFDAILSEINNLKVELPVFSINDTPHTELLQKVKMENIKNDETRITPPQRTIEGIEDFPPEILQYLFGFLPEESWQDIRLVSQLFKELADDPYGSYKTHPLNHFLNAYRTVKSAIMEMKEEIQDSPQKRIEHFSNQKRELITAITALRKKHSSPKGLSATDIKIINSILCHPTIIHHVFTSPDISQKAKISPRLLQIAQESFSASPPSAEDSRQSWLLLTLLQELITPELLRRDTLTPPLHTLYNHLFSSLSSHHSFPLEMKLLQHTTIPSLNSDSTLSLDEYEILMKAILQDHPDQTARIKKDINSYLAKSFTSAVSSRIARFTKQAEALVELSANQKNPQEPTSVCDNYIAHALAGTCNLRSGNTQQAQTYLNRSLELSEFMRDIDIQSTAKKFDKCSLALIHYNLGYCNEYHGEMDLAAQHYQQAIAKAANTSARAYIFLVKYYLDKKDTDAVIQCFLSFADEYLNPREIKTPISLSLVDIAALSSIFQQSKVESKYLDWLNTLKGLYME